MAKIETKTSVIAITVEKKKTSLKHKFISEKANLQLH